MAWSRLYIDGEWRDAATSDTIPVTNPATSKEIAAVPAGTEADVNDAYEAAEEAQSDWAALPREERNEYVQSIITVMQDRLDEVIEAACNGVRQRPIQGSRGSQFLHSRLPERTGDGPARRDGPRFDVPRA